MSMGEAEWRERAQTAEARVKTLKDQYEPALERVKAFKANFGVREKSDGSIVIDYEKLVAALGVEGSLELRATIDAVHGISGQPGEKPKVRVKAA